MYALREDVLLTDEQPRTLEPPLAVNRPEPTLRLVLRRWFRRSVPPLSLGRRAKAQVQLRDASTRDFD